MDTKLRGSSRNVNRVRALAFEARRLAIRQPRQACHASASRRHASFASGAPSIQWLLWHVFDQSLLST